MSISTSSVLYVWDVRRSNHLQETQREDPDQGHLFLPVNLELPRGRQREDKDHEAGDGVHDGVARDPDVPEAPGALDVVVPHGFKSDWSQAVGCCFLFSSV